MSRREARRVNVRWNTAMNFKALKKAVDVECFRIRQEPRSGAVQSYTLSGGGTLKKTWQTAGFFLEDGGDRRLVYELLHVRARKVCVLRVYWDEPLTILYALKFSTIAPIVSGACAEASRIFVASAREIRPSARDSEPTTAMIAKMPRGIRGLLSRVLSPIPPPVDLEAIQESEPSDEPNGASPRRLS